VASICQVRSTHRPPTNQPTSQPTKFNKKTNKSEVSQPASRTNNDKKKRKRKGRKKKRKRKKKKSTSDPAILNYSFATHHSTTVYRTVLLRCTRTVLCSPIGEYQASKQNTHTTTIHTGDNFILFIHSFIHPGEPRNCNALHCTALQSGD